MLRLKYREYFSDAAHPGRVSIFDTFQMTKKNGINPKHSKLRGELAELRFMTRAAEWGLRVIKPWGDSAGYDLVVEQGGRFLRVQVKAINYKVDVFKNCMLGTIR